MPGGRRPRAEAARAAEDAVAIPAGQPLAWQSVAERKAVPGAPGSVWRDPVTWAIAALVFSAYFTLSLSRLRQLNPASWDLGIYTEYVKQLSLLHAPVVDVRGPGFNLLGDHFTVALAVLAPFFRVVPSPATLLFFQALATAVSVFPVAAAGFAFAGRSAGRLIGFAYGFSWGLQQMNQFDFHEVALAVPLLAFSLSALVRRRPAATIGWALPLVFVKEDQGFTVAAIGMFLVGAAAFSPRLGIGGWRSRVPAATSGDAWKSGNIALWGGLFLVVWGLFWSVFAIAVIIPHFNPAHVYYFWRDGGVIRGGRHFSVGRLIQQGTDGWPVKLQTVVLLLLPTVFAALGSPVALLGLPSLLLRFISTNSTFWGTGWHYNATIMPVLFIAAAEVLGRWGGPPPALVRPRALVPAQHGAAAAARMSAAATAAGAARSASGPVRALLAAADAATAALGAARIVLRAARIPVRAARTGVARHGAAMMAAIAVTLAFQFPLNELWHSSTYQVNAHVAADNAAMAVVPDGATVQTTLGLLAPLAARTDTYWIGNAGNPLTQYVVFDGKDSYYTPAVTNVPAFIATVFPRDAYVQVFERDDVYVFRRALPGAHVSAAT